MIQYESLHTRCSSINYSFSFRIITQTNKNASSRLSVWSLPPLHFLHRPCSYNENRLTPSSSLRKMDQTHQKSNTIAHHLQDHHHPKTPTFLLDSLYCPEEHWEEEEEDEYATESFNGFGIEIGTKPTPPVLLEQDLFWDDDELSTLFAKEREQNQPRAVAGADPSAASCRRAAAEWMMRVVAHYSFSAPTAVLAVNCFDRFFSGFCFRAEKPWMAQLAAVACVSLAAKVEETHVPLLLDLQVEESKFVFEAKTIQRMEILVLSTLQWKMNPVTPLSFLDYIARRLGLKDRLCREFLRRCELIVVSAITDARFMCYLPSVMATATMLHVIDSVEPCLQSEYHTQILGILGIDHKDKVDDCCRLISELSLGSGGGYESKKRKFCSIPGSPNGVMDLSFNSDSSNDSWVVSSPEPLSKKSRAEEKQRLLQALSPH